jgi:hypothetical protein
LWSWRTEGDPRPASRLTLHSLRTDPDWALSSVYSAATAGRRLGVRICVVLMLTLMLVVFAAAAAHAATNNIFTVAGTTAGLSGDGGPATAGQLNLLGAPRVLP